MFQGKSHISLMHAHAASTVLFPYKQHFCLIKEIMNSQKHAQRSGTWIISQQ